VALLTIHLGVIWCLLFSNYPDTSLATIIDSTLSLVTTTAALSLHILEQSRCVKPSGVVLVYLACSLTRDSLELQVIPSCLSTGTCHLVKSRICIEGLWLTWDRRANDLFSRLGQKFAFIPEEAAGILSQIFFWWMHPLLREGYSARLNLATLPEIDEALSSQGLRKRALRFWVGRCNSLKPFEDAVQC
jgi:hypothetical protein